MELLSLSKIWLESRLVESMFAHQAATREEIAKRYRRRAGDLFGEGKDSLAQFLRDVLVPELEREAASLRSQQQHQKTVTASHGEPEEIP